MGSNPVQRIMAIYEFIGKTVVAILIFIVFLLVVIIVPEFLKMGINYLTEHDNKLIHYTSRTILASIGIGLLVLLFIVLYNIL